MTVASIWRRALPADFLRHANAATAATMMDRIGIRFSAVGADWLEATMPADDGTVQPFRILHGGASVALAETLGSYASYLVAGEGKQIVGVDINATHLRSVKHGSGVTGRATPIKLGKRLHIWEIKIHETGREDQGLTCISRLSVMVTDPQRTPHP